jgi:hypothetical protein
MKKKIALATVSVGLVVGWLLAGIVKRTNDHKEN